MPTIGGYTSYNSNINQPISTQASSLKSSRTAPKSTQKTSSSPTSSLISSLTANLTLQAASVVASSVTSLTSSIANSLTSSSDSSISSLASLSSPISDPISSSLGGQSSGTGSQATAFVTSAMVSSTDPIDFSNNASTSATSLSGLNLSALSVTAARQGYSTPTTNKELSNLNSISFGSGVSTILGSVVTSGLESVVSIAASSAVSAVESAVGLTSGQQSFVSANILKFGGVSGANTLLAEGYNSSYPSITDANGNAIPGIPTDTDTGLFSSLAGVIGGVCNEFQTPTITQYANQQSLNDIIIGLTVDNGLLSFLSSIADCSEIMTNQSKRTLANRLPAISSNTALTAAAVGIVGGALVNGAANIISSMCSTSSITSTSVSDIQSVMSATGQTPDGVFGVDDINNNTVWNSDQIAALDPSISNSICGSDVTTMSGMSDADIIT